MLISGLATGPRQGWAAGSDRFGLCELRVSQHFSTFYGPSVQAMDTQLKRSFPDRPEMAIRPHGRPKNQHNGFWHLVCLKTSPVGLTRSRFQIADRLTYSGCEESC